MSVNLKMQNQKLELIQWLFATEDVAIIEKIMDIRNKESADFWNVQSEVERKSIEQGIKDADSGKLISHSIARKLYEKWL